MKKKIAVEIHKTGSENDGLLRLVGNVNGMGLGISKSAIMAYLAVKMAMFPLSSNYSTCTEGDTLHVSEDGGDTFTLSLTWKDVYELDQSENDLPSGLFEAPGTN